MLNKLKKVFASFQQHEVRYVVLGGIASVLYGVPRATFDLDILIDAEHSNAGKLLKALSDAGFGTAHMITPEELLENEITVFKDLVRIDVQTSTPGINFCDAWKNKAVMDYKGQEFFILSLDDLIASKKAAGRPVDLEDVRLLEQNLKHTNE